MTIFESACAGRTYPGRVERRGIGFSLLCAAAGFIFATNFASAQSKYAESAPDDAFFEGSDHAFYGSENPWNLRMFSPRNAISRYNRRSQRQLLAILDGRTEEAEGDCRDWIANDRMDLESRFMLAVAQCQLGVPDEAFLTLVKLVADGLPPERIVAGPRDLLQPVYQLPTYQDFEAARAIQLVHGPMLGAVTNNSARFWVRTANESAVEIRVLDLASNGDVVATGTGNTKAGHDFATVIEVQDLSPDMRYEYEVLVDGRVVPMSFLDEAKRPAFKSRPRRGAPTKFRFAFGGGAAYTQEHERMWDTIGTRNFDALFLLGDNVYVDLPRIPGAFHQYTYYRRQSRPEFRRLTATTPVYSIWDDHDAATDDAWLGPFRDRPSWKAPTLAFFRSNWNNPGYGDQEWPGCWYAFSSGDIDFFFLDCRYYRTNPFDKSPTMLGPVQKAWLFESLKNSSATFKVIASSVPFASDAKPGSHDTWDGFPDERRELFEWIDAHTIDGVLFISADRHRSDAWRIDRPSGYPLFEFNSSRLTNRHTHEPVPGSLFSYNAKCSFGDVTLDTTIEDPTATYRVINIDGEEMHQISVRRSQLTNSRENE